MVALWHETLDPAPALAAHHLAARLPEEAWPEGADARQAEWLRQARSPAGREAELMRVFDFVRVKAAHVLERFEAMAAWEPHPVVTRWLVDVFARQTRTPMFDGQKCFRRVFRLLEKHVDLEGAGRFRAWIGTHGSRIHAAPAGAEFFDWGMRRVLEKATRRLAAARPLAEAERAALERAGLLVASPGPSGEPTHEALLEAVYEAPWDDTPRQILGDLLQQRGEPRGEFIALDLLPSPTAGQRRRRNELLRKHGKDWFPPGLHRIVRRGAKYERGFLAYGELAAARTAIELSTFRELKIQCHDLPDLDDPVFRAIEVWRGLPVFPPGDPRGAPLATCGPQARVRRVELATSYRHEAAAIVAALRPEAWPALAEVSVGGGFDGWAERRMPAWFDAIAAGLGGRLPRLEQLELAGVARYRREGGALRLIEVSLGPDLARSMVSQYVNPIIVEAKARWLAWLAATGAPITTPCEAAGLRRHLPPEAAARVREATPA